MTEPAVRLKTTPLNAVHRALGAKMVDFGGWDMPLQYSGILEEHRAVRQAVGLFDVSHMGEIEIEGQDARVLTDYVTTNSVAGLEPGQAQYSGLLYEHGGFIDDILVHKVSEEHYFLCVNAANQEKDYEHIVGANRFDAEVNFASGFYVQLALQGPQAGATLGKLTATPLQPIAYYHFVDGEVSGVPTRIARTGYTGEDGFEIYFAPEYAERIWNDILDAGRSLGIKPCGLGARNTLRLEAKMALYGHEISDKINVWEAGLDRYCKMEKGDFIGRAALERAKPAGLTRTLVGIEMIDRGIARDEYCCCDEAGEKIGVVTSGSPSPTLGKNIALAYVPPAYSAVGMSLYVDIRGQKCKARVVATPFYKRQKKAAAPHVN